MAWPHDPIARYASAFRPLKNAPAPLPLLALEEGQCKWPVGEHPFVFCGEATTDGRYCAVHGQRSGTWLEALA